MKNWTVKDVINWATIAGLAITILGFHMADHQMLLNHEGKIQGYENRGTPSVTAMKAQYDEHFRATDDRLNRLEGIAVSLNEVKTGLQVLNTSVSDMKASLEEHKRQGK